MFDKKYRGTLLIAMAVLIVILAHNFLALRNQRSMTQHVGDTVQELSQGVDKSGQQLDGRTISQMFGIGVKNDGDKIKDSTPSNN